MKLQAIQFSVLIIIGLLSGPSISAPLNPSGYQSDSAASGGEGSPNSGGQTLRAPYLDSRPFGGYAAPSPYSESGASAPTRPQAPPATAPNPDTSIEIGHKYSPAEKIYFYCFVDDISSMNTYYSLPIQIEWNQIEGNESELFLSAVRRVHPDSGGTPTCTWNMDRYYQLDTIKHAKFADVLHSRTPVDVQFSLDR